MSKRIESFKIALVHDWLLGVGGAEKTLKALHDIYPEAPIYTLFQNRGFTQNFLPKATIINSYLQKFYNILGSQKMLTPFLPTAIESFDLSGFDLVISSSVAFSKGLILKPQTKHICYCYSPTRQLWDWHAEYKSESHRAPKFIVNTIMHLLRIWDRQASTRVDDFVAISHNVKNRIKKYYHREAEVIYPPVTLGVSANKTTGSSNYFLIVSRLYKHKNIDITIKAFNKLEMPLVIIGNGPEFKHLKKIAGPNIKFLGYLPDDEIYSYYANCLAFIMPQEEDFGITPIEALSYGKPVLALRRGGALEYIKEGINGEFFDDATEEILADGVRRLKLNLPNYNSEIIKKTSEHFSENRFRQEIRGFVEKHGIS